MRYSKLIDNFYNINGRINCFNDKIYTPIFRNNFSNSSTEETLIEIGTT